MLLRGERVRCFQVGVRKGGAPGVGLASVYFFLVGATSSVAEDRDGVSRGRLLL